MSNNIVKLVETGFSRYTLGTLRHYSELFVAIYPDITEFLTELINL